MTEATESPLQHELFHESSEDALQAVVMACGGFKRVGAELWPDRSPDKAGIHLRHCLDTDRAEKLSLDQIVYLLRRGHEIGCHVAMHYLCTTVGYQRPNPVTPEDQTAELHRKYIEATKYIGKLAAQIEANERTSLRRVG